MKFFSSYTSFSVCALLMLLIVVPRTVCLAAEEGADAPVYLDEPPQSPPAREVRHLTRKQKYKDESIRLEYQVLQMSDDTLVNDGTFVEYYVDGQKFQEGTFKHGTYDGLWTYWHPNGQICKSITFKNGRPHGQWEVFRSDGTRLATQGYAVAFVTASGSVITRMENSQWCSTFSTRENSLVLA